METSGSAKGSINIEKMKSKIDVDKAETVQNHALGSSQVIASDRDNSTRPAEVTAFRSPEIQDLSTEGDVKVLPFLSCHLDRKLWTLSICYVIDFINIAFLWSFCVCLCVYVL